MIEGGNPWALWQIGKVAESIGIIHRGQDDQHFASTAEYYGLELLADQKGHAVSLRGTAWSLNGHWWFEYRRQRLYVEGMKDLPGWNLNSDVMGISGTLEEAVLPDITQIGLKEHPDLKRTFIIRKPAWKPIKELLSPEIIDDNPYIRGYSERKYCNGYRHMKQYLPLVPENSGRIMIGRCHRWRRILKWLL